ncbi:hypothetical protein MRB53_018123 [Persea americana]|uniref:Uncharacterized protein n=1 Tax=Persea americana TaxID=3435 RepID=A0ACC2M7X7_PERAE|nr:hypothetical protein MRB53_018123 [Persea americana]
MVMAIEHLHFWVAPAVGLLDKVVKHLFGEEYGVKKLEGLGLSRPLMFTMRRPRKFEGGNRGHGEPYLHKPELA